MKALSRIERLYKLEAESELDLAVRRQRGRLHTDRKKKRQY
jgi:hypothetical protein